MNLLGNVEVEMIRKLECYTPTLDTSRNSEIASGLQELIVKTPALFTDSSEFHFFSLITDPDGSLWVDGNRYLLSFLSGILKVKHRTIESIASDLACFRRWLLNEDIDYLDISSRPRARPTYRFTKYLHNEIKTGRYSHSTCKRIIGNIQNFYRWLKKDGKKLNAPLWKESEKTIVYCDKKGFLKNRTVKSTDLSASFKTSNSKDDFSGFIHDGGMLRPLPLEEQEAIVKGLNNLSNVEMRLAFYLALSTGARLQTVFTLRRGNFKSKLPSDITSIPIQAGDKTLVDTKYGKEMILLVPKALYQMIRIYKDSERCQKRNKIAQNVLPDDEQYLFLSRFGQCYYMSEREQLTTKLRYPPRGNGVTQFINQQLKPKLRELGHNFHFRFHDLRATFGLNLVSYHLDQNIASDGLVNKKSDMAQALLYLKKRMGHESISTTENYINYKSKNKFVCETQAEYEKYLESMFSHEDNQNVD